MDRGYGVNELGFFFLELCPSHRWSRIVTDMMWPLIPLFLQCSKTFKNEQYVRSRTGFAQQKPKTIPRTPNQSKVMPTSHLHTKETASKSEFAKGTDDSGKAAASSHSSTPKQAQATATKPDSEKPSAKHAPTTAARQPSGKSLNTHHVDLAPKQSSEPKTHVTEKHTTMLPVAKSLNDHELTEETKGVTEKSVSKVSTEKAPAITRQSSGKSISHPHADAAPKHDKEKTTDLPHPSVATATSDKKPSAAPAAASVHPAHPAIHAPRPSAAAPGAVHKPSPAPAAVATGRPIGASPAASKGHDAAPSTKSSRPSAQPKSTAA